MSRGGTGDEGKTATTSHDALYDVTGWGVVAVDDVLYVREFPGADAKVRAERTERRLGGLTGVALLAVANLGGTPCYAGVLGTDPLSQFVRDVLSAGEVDVSAVREHPKARPVHAFVVVAPRPSSRTIFYTPAGRAARKPDRALRDLVLRSRVLFVDPLSLRDSEPMLRLAHAHRIPIVADIEAEHADTSRPVTPMIDHMVVPLSAARVLSGCETPETAARALAANRRAAVVTLGEQGCWYAAGPKAERVRHLPAFRVEARNTTGCGDVFHGAYALGVARGWPLERCVAFAAAAAAVRAEGSASAGAVTRASRVRELLRNRRTME